MKHQIALVGGQILPIYLGIKEYNPDKVHFIISNESKEKLSLLKPYLAGIQTTEYSCNAYDFDSVKNICERIIDQIDQLDEINFNFTGGTKLMALAAHAIMHERSKVGFYVNQDDTLLEFPSNIKRTLQCNLSIKEFVGISGHELHSSKTLQDFSDRDILTARQIETFAINNFRKYSSITDHFRKKSKATNQKIPIKGKEVLNNGIEVIWDNENIKAVQNKITVFSFNSDNVIPLFFNTVWWELLVASEITKWKFAKEVLLQCELPFKSDKQIMKNEIDILINLGKKLIFIECKSGTVKPEDINKMRVIRETYGGLISKSMLVSRHLPSATIIEKCKELDIEIFYCYAFNRLVSPLSRLASALTNLNKKLIA